MRSVGVPRTGTTVADVDMLTRTTRPPLSRSACLPTTTIAPLLYRALLLATTAQGQTMFIADTYPRAWLNNAKPGMVDGGGN